jgi:hypothetical protein
MALLRHTLDIVGFVFLGHDQEGLFGDLRHAIKYGGN